MDTTTLATEIAGKVIADTSFWVAVVGLAGVVVGAIITVVGNFLLHWFQDSPRRKLDEGRKKLLEQMLRDTRFKDHWRKITTLSRVVGADEETTKRLLIELGARGSEKDDGLWGLLEHHPLDKLDQ
ncbi:MAG: hypothetical protein KKE83_00750 [Proteobacteria bacterium]|nr:hypothetical protein [Pseudomonadota bacterium]MBU1545177.1 hypothetical protein [Pseudomonadota bacterium]MBU2618197.1 hypothetical protein [Pseudomonadota bacterium]